MFHVLQCPGIIIPTIEAMVAPEGMERPSKNVWVNIHITVERAQDRIPIIVLVTLILESQGIGAGLQSTVALVVITLTSMLEDTPILGSPGLVQ